MPLPVAVHMPPPPSTPLGASRTVLLSSWIRGATASNTAFNGAFHQATAVEKQTVVDVASRWVRPQDSVA